MAKRRPVRLFAITLPEDLHPGLDVALWSVFISEYLA